MGVHDRRLLAAAASSVNDERAGALATGEGGQGPSLSQYSAVNLRGDWMTEDDRKQEGNIPVIRIDDADLADLSALLGEPLAPTPQPMVAARAPDPDALTGGVVHIDVDEDGGTDDDFEALLQRTLGEAAGEPAVTRPPRAPSPMGPPPSPSRAPRPWSGKPPKSPGSVLQKLAEMRREGRPPREPSREERHREESRVIDELRQKVKDLNTETDKFRKRIAAEAQGARMKGRADVFKQLLPVLDTMELALKAAHESRDYEQLVSGVDLTFRQFLSVLRGLDVEDVEPTGQSFDPARHEACQQVRTGTAAAGTVVQVIRRGYVFDGKLLRPAQVVVEA